MLLRKGHCRSVALAQDEDGGARDDDGALGLTASATPHPPPGPEAGTRGGFGLVFYQAIYAGWLIAHMAWLLGSTTSRGAQLVLIWLCTAAISALEFRHSIVGAVEAFYRAAAGSAAWGEMLGGFVVPSVPGNALGGVVLVALLNYAQVRSDLPPRPHTRGSHAPE